MTGRSDHSVAGGIHHAAGLRHALAPIPIVERQRALDSRVFFLLAVGDSDSVDLTKSRLGWVPCALLDSIYLAIAIRASIVEKTMYRSCLSVSRDRRCHVGSIVTNTKENTGFECVQER